MVPEFRHEHHQVNHTVRDIVPMAAVPRSRKSQEPSQLQSVGAGHSIQARGLQSTFPEALLRWSATHNRAQSNEDFVGQPGRGKQQQCRAISHCGLDARQGAEVSEAKRSAYAGHLSRVVDHSHNLIRQAGKQQHQPRHRQEHRQSVGPHLCLRRPTDLRDPHEDQSQGHPGGDAEAPPQQHPGRPDKHHALRDQRSQDRDHDAERSDGKSAGAASPGGAAGRPAPRGLRRAGLEPGHEVAWAGHVARPHGAPGGGLPCARRHGEQGLEPTAVPWNGCAAGGKGLCRAHRGCGFNELGQLLLGQALPRPTLIHKPTAA
mmetsp:Transcript_139992/g.314317  ORF Transcript_139992/g.314317 Transcript_139992/m.314317 type:complete len:318 (-) Transcript_139992:1153-2106(-)